MALYERGKVRIHYEEAGSGFPLLIIPGGGLNATVGFFKTSAPFDAMEEFKDEYRCITLDARNANGGESVGPLEVERPWDAYADDQPGLMDHLGIDKFLVMGFCIGGPFIWNLLRRAPGRIVAAVPTWERYSIPSPDAALERGAEGQAGAGEARDRVAFVACHDGGIGFAAHEDQTGGHPGRLAERRAGAWRRRAEALRDGQWNRRQHSPSDEAAH